MQSSSRYKIQFEPAICYSGFRAGQAPGHAFPSYDEVKEDLLILQRNWRYLRLYDCDQHAQTVLDVIEQEQLDIKLMLGAYIGAEMNNFGCPWGGGGSYTEEELEQNKINNEAQIQKLIDLANKYPTIIHSLSAGNEATVDWTDHYVPVSSVINYVKKIQANTEQPVTFCENYVPWLNKLQPLAEVVDFISIHTYPVWEYKHIHEALEFTKQNYESVANLYPHKPVVITEAGWTTNSNGVGICSTNVCEQRQQTYYQDLMQWSQDENILTFVFEAFDELWKGSDEPMEPEKHWGLFTIDRTPKRVMQEDFPELLTDT